MLRNIGGDPGAEENYQRYLENCQLQIQGYTNILKKAYFIELNELYEDRAKLTTTLARIREEHVLNELDSARIEGQIEDLLKKLETIILKKMELQQKRKK